MLRGAEVALQKLGGEVSASDKLFYEGKVAAAQFFAQPQPAASSAPSWPSPRRPTSSLMELDEGSF